MSLPSGLSAIDLNTAHLYEQVADLLEHEILNSYKDGDRLPSELSLADTFRVSRTVIREALKLLRERGLVDLRRGSAALVTRPEARNLSAVISRIIQLNGIDYNDIYDVRIMVEVTCIRLAAVRATSEDLCAMKEQLMLLKDRNLVPEVRRDADYAFHLLIARAAGNRLQVVLLETLSHIFREMMNAGIFVQGGIDDAIQRHTKIYDALVARDADLAEIAMREHLEQSRRHVAQYQASLPTEPIRQGADQ